MKFSFLAKNYDEICEFTFEADTWMEAMTKFVQFLRGAGFYVKDGEWVEWRADDEGSEADHT